MAIGRALHSATTLNDGRILVAGGLDENESVMSSAEIFDPVTNSWSFTTPMQVPLIYTASVLLKDGRVMVFGSDLSIGEAAVAVTQIYDPQTNSWSSGNFSRGLAISLYDAASLNDGRVILTGGIDEKDPSRIPVSRVATYSPSLDLWRPIIIIREMLNPRTLSASTLLNDGRVFIMGGVNFIGGNTNYLGSPEIYDVASNSWTSVPASNTSWIFWHSLATLPDGKVLMTGGSRQSGQANTAEVYDLNTNSWSIVASMNHERWNHASVTLDDGRVLVIGGTSAASDPSEIYNPATNSWMDVAPLGVPPTNKYSAVKLKDGRVLALAGSRVLIYDPEYDTWTEKSSMLVHPDRNQAVLAILNDGRALVTLGLVNGDSTPTNTSEIYDPATDTWVEAAAFDSSKFPQGKVGAFGVTLNDGRVIVLGGLDMDNKFDLEIKLYNAVTDSWE